MSVELVIAPEAEIDLAGAYSWYEQQRGGLGAEFLNCVDACIQNVIRHPEMYTAVYRSFRRALVRRFPYGIFYEYSCGAVTVYGIFHSAEDPQKWRLRLE